jgi:hypothetical protein
MRNGSVVLGLVAIIAAAAPAFAQQPNGTGKRPDGRELAPIMPWRDLANLSDGDARSIALYLRNLPPISNKVPGPFGPGEKVTTFTMKISPPEK